MLADKTYVRQALNLSKHLRLLGYDKKLCLLLLDPISKNIEQNLLRLRVELHEVDYCSLPSDAKKSGLKLWLPLFVKANSYVILDTDIIPLSPGVVASLAPPEARVTLVRESEIFWRERKYGITISEHRSIIGKQVLQTGAIGLSRSTWEEIFPSVQRLICVDSSHFGDMVAINMFFHENPELLKAVPEEICLVLRPSGKGISTGVHLRHTSYKYPAVYYKGKRVSAIHYTRSFGTVCTIESLASLFNETVR